MMHFKQQKCRRCTDEYTTAAVWFCCSGASVYAHGWCPLAAEGDANVWHYTKRARGLRMTFRALSKFGLWHWGTSRRRRRVVAEAVRSTNRQGWMAPPGVSCT